MRKASKTGFLCLVILLLDVAPSWGARFVRVNRPFREMIELYEAAFFSRVEENESVDPRLTVVSEAQILDEILGTERWKFGVLHERNFFNEDGANLQQKVQTVEGLLKHDEILVLYEWEPYVPDNFRTPIAMVAFKRLTAEKDSRLLLEQLNQISISRPDILNEPVPNLPHHWRPEIAATSKIKRYFGDILQINSLIISHRHGQRFLNYLYGLAYWHGLLTTGRVIPEGIKLEINGRSLEGPAVLVPTLYVGEGYGSRARAYERLDFERLAIDGQKIFESPHQQDVFLSIMFSQWNNFFLELPRIMVDRLELTGQTVATFMGPLAVVPMQYTGPRVTGVFPLDRKIEQALRNSCHWTLALLADEKIPSRLPLQKPTASFSFH